MQQAEEHRNKEQSGGRGKNQATNHRPAEWPLLLSAFAQTVCLGHHADDYGQSRHQDLAEAGQPRPHRGQSGRTRAGLPPSARHPQSGQCLLGIVARPGRPLKSLSHQGQSNFSRSLANGT